MTPSPDTAKTRLDKLTCSKCGHIREIRRKASTPKTHKYFCDGCRKTVYPLSSPGPEQELFELCKKVYELHPDWNSAYKYFSPEHEILLSNGSWDKVPLMVVPKWHRDGTSPNSDYVPLYTSDYLLEKLPATIESREYPGKRAGLWVGKRDDGEDEHPQGSITYFAWYFVNGIVDCVSDFGESADTPRKALLKLTIALKEAGVEL